VGWGSREHKHPGVGTGGLNKLHTWPLHHSAKRPNTKGFGGARRTAATKTTVLKIAQREREIDMTPKASNQNICTQINIEPTHHWASSI
jgi:hypothetical protein